MKNFVKAMDGESSEFAFLQKFSRIGMARINSKNKHYQSVKASIFDGPQIRRLMKDPSCLNEVLSETELSTWQSLK